MWVIIHSDAGDLQRGGISIGGVPAGKISQKGSEGFLVRATEKTDKQLLSRSSADLHTIRD